MSRSTLLALGLVVVAPPAQAQVPPTPRLADPTSTRAVTLALDDYNRLVDLAERRPADPPATPVAAVVTSASLVVRADRDLARGEFALTGAVLRQGVHRVPLIANTTLHDVRTGNQPVPLVHDASSVSALLTGPGPIALTMDWAAPVTTAPGQARFTLPVPKAGAVRATIDVPGDQADVRVAPGVITARRVVNGRTIVDVTLEPGTATDVSWSMRDAAPVAATRDVRVLADVLTLVTVAESDVRLTTLVDIDVPRGTLRTLALGLPRGYELTGVSGPSLVASEPADGRLMLTLAEVSAPRHQVLITLERPRLAASGDVATDVVTVEGAHRERGEVALEGTGAMHVVPEERLGVQRIDVREVHPALQALARAPFLTAARYQRAPGASAPRLGYAVERFADAEVVGAVATAAHATTLVTSEGRALTEIRLQLRNRAQPFMKVTLPPGASIVSAEVDGEPVKPATGVDGTRVPLMRAGLGGRRNYEVAFVYVHAGTALQRKGEIEMALPAMDVPTGIVQWELFVPDRYRTRVVGGNALDTTVFQVRGSERAGLAGTWRPLRHQRTGRVRISSFAGGLPEQVRGTVTDEQRAILPGTTLTLRVNGYVKSAVTDERGEFVFSGVPAGTASIDAELAGFTTERAVFEFDGSPRWLEFALAIGMLTETLTVTGESPRDTRPPEFTPPSESVVELQQRIAGVLPIRVDVPRQGTSRMLIRPLVVGDETTVRLRYTRRR